MNQDVASAQFETLLRSVILRVVERRQSDAALFRLFAAHGQARLIIAKGLEASEPDIKELLANHQKIEYRNFQQIDAEYCRDSVIVAATLFDSFLTDVTQFMLLLRPKAVPKDRQIRFADALNAGTISALITQAVERYTHEISYKNIRERITFLQDKFGIDVSALEPDIEKCQSLANLRNTLVHVASRYTYTSDDHAGGVRVDSRNLPVVDPSTAEASLADTYAAIVALARQVGIKVFGRPPKSLMPTEPASGDVPAHS